MSSDYKHLSRLIMEYECYRRCLIHESLKDSNVYFGQPPILEYLSEHGSSTQNEIAKAMNVSPASIAVSIKRMQKSGLIEKISDENDMRCNKISLTESGRRQSLHIRHKLEDIDNKLFKGFSEEELTAFDGYLVRLIQNVSDELPEKYSMAQMMGHGFDHKNGGGNK